jgi:large subunit ribosomal protein L5
MIPLFSELYYKKRISQDLLLKQNYTSIMELPTLHKVVCNTSSKNYILDRKNILSPLIALEFIGGQKPKFTQAKKSIASFKLRQDQVLGCSLTLRKSKMYNFLQNYLFVVSPSMRDLGDQKLNGANIDGAVLNFNLFPELQKNYEIFQNLKGIDIHITVTLKKQKDALLLYSAFQIPVKA